jgi:uncharacterized damage-inducible protein DinB
MKIEEIRRLFAYTEWANARAVEAAEKLNAEQLLRDVQISHKSILGTLLHMAGAEWIWLERWLGDSPTGPQVWVQWQVSDSSTLEQLREKWQPLIAKRTAYLSRLTDAELHSERRFTRLNGETASLPLGHQMQHVINHATHHRGQVIGMIRQFGITPPSTDLLVYLLEAGRS